MRVTTYDIAKACGVSQATVDRALNNRSKIRAETKEKILKAVEEMGYRPTSLPTYLKTGKTNTIGVIMPDPTLFYAELIASICKAARIQGYHIHISFSGFNAEIEKEYLAEYLNSNVDGIILFPVSEDGSEIKKIINAGVPVVTLVRKLKNYNFNFVSIDYCKIAEQAIQYLIDLGHTKICYFTIWDNSSNLYTYRERLKGYENALKKNDIALNPRFIVRDSNGFQILRELLDADDKPTAYFCFNDLTTIGLVSFFNSLRIRIPNDVSIISFDNVDALKYFSPGLTSIAYPYDEMCGKAVDILVDKIKNNTPESESSIFEARLIQRYSCRKI